MTRRKPLPMVAALNRCYMIHKIVLKKPKRLLTEP